MGVGVGLRRFSGRARSPPRCLGFCRSQLIRFFKRATGVTPSQYQIKLRIEAAWRLLRETKKNVIAIAIEVGYTNPSHFARLFRKEGGLLPLTIGDSGRFIDTNSRSEAGHLLELFRIASPEDCDLRGGVIDLPKIFRCEFERDCPNVFLQAM